MVFVCFFFFVFFFAYDPEQNKTNGTAMNIFLQFGYNLLQIVSKTCQYTM